MQIKSSVNYSRTTHSEGNAILMWHEIIMNIIRLLKHKAKLFLKLN